MIEECRQAIYKAKHKKAVGIDCLTNDLFKQQSSLILFLT